MTYLFGTTSSSNPTPVVQSSTYTLASATNNYAFSGTVATTWTLPAISGNTGVELKIKNRGTVTLTITRAGTDQIYDTGLVTSVSILTGASATFVNDGTYWIKR